MPYFFIKHISNQNKKNDSKKTVGRIESERLVLFLFIYLIQKKCNQNMLNNKKQKKTIETSLKANLMKEPMSALFFWRWLKLIIDFLART